MTQSTDPVNWQEVADTVESLIELADNEFLCSLDNATYTNKSWYDAQHKQHEENMMLYYRALAKIKEQI